MKLFVNFAVPSNSDYFVYIPIEQQIKQSIETNIDEDLNYHSAVQSNEEIGDIHNAKIFIETQQNLKHAIVLPLIINTNGVKIYQSTKKSLWLILFYQCYLKPENRFKPFNVMIVASHFGDKKRMN